MISVAIATYNGEKYIRKQLESIYNQHLAVDEVVICDDISNDNTVKICEEFISEKGLSNWHLFVNEQNVGFCLNFYGAIAKCQGDVIFLADQDDEWLPDKTLKMIECLNKNPDISVLSCRYDVIDANSEIIENSGVTYLGTKNDNSIEFLDVESFIGCSYIRGFSLCFRREIASLLKPIDLKSLLAHDWLICALGCITGKTAVLNTILTHYRYHGDNVSLAAIDKSKRTRELNKRILGVSESVSGHKYIASFCEGELKKKIETFIAFETKRIKFLQSKNIFSFFALFFKMKHYNRYYKGKGLRVYLGDFVYAYKQK